MTWWLVVLTLVASDLPPAPPTVEPYDQLAACTRRVRSFDRNAEKRAFCFAVAPGSATLARP